MPTPKKPVEPQPTNLDPEDAPLRPLEDREPPEPQDEAEIQRVQDAALNDSGRIKRETNRAWWCPLCGHSNATLVTTCGGCGAERDGDMVKRKGD